MCEALWKALSFTLALAQVVPVTLQSPRGCLSPLSTAHPCYPVPLCLSYLPFSAVAFILLGFIWFTALFSTCTCLRNCSASGTRRSGVATEKTEFGEALQAAGCAEVRWFWGISVLPGLSQPSQGGLQAQFCRICWTSLRCRQGLLCWSEGRRQLHVREVWPNSIMLHCHFPQSIYQQLLQPLVKKRAVFLPSNKSECSIGTTYIYFYTW